MLMEMIARSFPDGEVPSALSTEEERMTEEGGEGW